MVKGTIFYEDGGKKYEGAFSNNNYNGTGKLYRKNGNIKYEGEFKDGEYEGKGVYYFNY